MTHNINGNIYGYYLKAKAIIWKENYSAISSFLFMEETLSILIEMFQFH